MKHTKGKWIIKNLNSKTEWTEIYSYPYSDNDECSICKIYAGLLLGEEKANAKLIAAAPELLATLEDILWTSEQRKARGGKSLQRELNVLDSIREVIKKATE